MSWQDDLADLLGQVGGGVASDLGGEHGQQILGAAGAALEAPKTAVKFGTGALLGGINETLGLLPGQPGYYPDQSAAFHRAGPLGMFEAVRQREYRDIPGIINYPFQFATEALLDPTTYLGPAAFGLPGRIGERAALGLRAGATAADLAERPILSAGLQGGARAAEAGQFLYNDMYDQALGYMGRTRAGVAVKRAGGSVVSRIPGINELAPEFAHRADFASSANANLADRSKGDRVLPIVGKITSQSGPPIVPHLHPTGSVPDQIYKRGIKGWVNTWLANRDGPGRLGIIAGTNEFGVAQATPALSHADLESMVDVSLQSMQGAIDDSELFGSVRLAAVEGPKWRDQMLAQFGEQTQGALPHVWEEMRRRNPDLNLPAAQFTALPTAFPNTKDFSSDYLAEINAQYKAGQITRQDALEKLSQSNLKHPQALEAMAAHGTALMSGGRTGGSVEDFRRGGIYAPQIDPTTGRVGVPQGFTQDVLRQAGAGAVPHDFSTVLGKPLPYGSNRLAWEAYMQEQMGKMAPDELETLARISIDQYYRTLVSAAHRYALTPEELAQGVTYKGGKGRFKVGISAANESQRGSPTAQRLIRGMTDFATSTKFGGRITERDLWARQLQELRQQEGPITRADLNEILGETKTNAHITGTEIKQALLALDETPIGLNPKGGLLPNVTELMDWYARGQDLGIATGLGADAKSHYDRAAAEMAHLLGLGNYREFRVLATMMGLQSGGTHVEDGVRTALKAFAEYLYRHDETLQQRFQMNGEEFTQLLDDGTEEGAKRGQIEQLMNLNESQRVPLPNGPKEGNYAASFLVPHWRSQLEELVRNLPEGVQRQAKADFDAAVNAFAVDRHISRIDNGPTLVSSLQHHIIRARHVIAARKAGLSPEVAHGSAWFLARGQQGFRILHPESDAAEAVRKVVSEMFDAGGKPSDESFAQMLQRVQEETGKTGEALYQEVYQIAHQDIAQRMVAAVLADPQIGPRLRKLGLPSTVKEIDDSVNGVIARGAHGFMPHEWPNPLGSSMELGDQVEALAANPPPAPTIFSFSSGSWQPVQGGAHAVPIMDGGTFTAGQVQTARKRFEQLVSQDIVAQVFDPVSGDRSKQLGIGVVPDGDRFRISLYALTGDPALAEEGAVRAGARHIVDTTTGTMTPTRVTTPRRASLPTLLSEMFGEAPPTIDPTLEQARKRGVTMSEMDRRNPISWFQRRVLNPLMDAYEALTKREGPANMTRTMADLGIEQHPSATEYPYPGKGYDFQLSATDNAALLRKTNRGVTHKEIIAKGAREGGEAQKAFQDAGVGWKPFANIDERRKAVAGNADLTKLVNKWHRLGIDPLHARHPDDIGLALLEREMRKDAGLKVGRSTVPQLLAAAWGEQVLASGKYLTGNVFGNWVMSALAGHPMPLSPQQFLAAYKMLRNGVDETTHAEALRSLKGGELFRKYGLNGLPQEVMRGGIREVTSNTARYSPSATGELVGRLTRSERLGRIIGAPFVILNDMAQAADVVARSSIMGDVLDQRMQEMLPVWEEAVRQAGAGIPGFEFSVADNINIPAGGLHTGPLYRSLQEAGLQPGQAERLVRDYTNIRSRALGDARKEMERVLFSFNKTKADVWIGKFVPFHYWYSRALRFYAEESVRHPYLAVNYMRANEGIEEAQNDPGLSARQKGFIGLFGTPLGFSLLMNPDALFGVTKVFSMEDAFEADGQTSLGGAMAWLQQRGLGVYPWLDASMNLMGMYGNTFEPDLLGLRHKALVGAAINAARAQFGFAPAGAPYADAMGQVRYSVSAFVDSFTPDWLTKTVTPRAGGSSQEAALDTIIENIILDGNPGLTNQQLLDIMLDPESPEYNSAFRTASQAGLVQQLLNFTAPVSFRMRYDARDVRLAQMSSITEAADAKGVPAYQFAPTKDDLAFRAKYKALTGREWKPGDYADAKLKNDLSRAPSANKQFILDESTYYDLGSPTQQQALTKYQDLLFGTDPTTAGMTDPTARRAMANRWADRHRKAGRAVDELYALRDTFSSTHPDFAEFQDWRGRVRNLASQYGGTLSEYRRRVSAASPNAARYFAEQEADIRTKYPQEQWTAQMDAITVSAAAFQSITGRGTSNRLSPGGAASRYEQGPYPGAPTFDAALPSMEPPPPQPGTNWSQVADTLLGPYHPRM